MTVAVVRGTELRCSVPVLLLFPAAVVLGRTDAALILLVSLAVHELAHAFMASRLGFPVLSLEIQPFGFIAVLERPPDTPSEAAAIAAAGPFISLLLAFCAFGLLFMHSGALPPGLPTAALHRFASFNLSLGAVNLLPALPLDGGRLACALIESRAGDGRSRTQRLLTLLGTGAGAVIALSGAAVMLIEKRPSPAPVTALVTGSFIAPAALTELRRLTDTRARRTIAAYDRLRSGGALRAEFFALSASATVRDALRALSRRGYGLIIVTDEGLKALGVIDRGRLFEAAARGQTDQTLAALLSELRGKYY